jgi:hypothetical protein
MIAMRSGIATKVAAPSERAWFLRDPLALAPHQFVPPAQIERGHNFSPWSFNMNKKSLLVSSDPVANRLHGLRLGHCACS